MFKNLIRRLLGTAFSADTFVARARTCDVAYAFRMPAGFPGFVNRSHPANIEPCLVDPDDPPNLFGQAVVVDAVTQGVRHVVAGDVALANIYGITVRPYPTQQASGGMDASFGAGTPNPVQPVDVLRWGYIMSKVNGDPVKGGAVYVWCAADAGDHVQGQFEAAASGGNTLLLPNAEFNGSPDDQGNVEIILNVGGPRASAA